MHFKNLFSFSGRSSRKSYWLEVILWSIVAIVVNSAMGIDGATRRGTGPSLALLLFALLYFIGLSWVSYGLMARRLHDTGRSGWYALRWVGAWFVGALVFVVSMVGAIAQGNGAYSLGVFLAGLIIFVTWAHSLYVLGFKRGDEGVNQFGEPNTGSVF